MLGGPSWAWKILDRVKHNRKSEGDIIEITLVLILSCDYDQFSTPLNTEQLPQLSSCLTHEIKLVWAKARLGSIRLT